MRVFGPHGIVSAERLAVRWLETRVEQELAVYPRLCRIAHGILEEGLSASVITPGQTTTDDLAWWLRARVSDLGLGTWFHPSVSVQRAADGRGDDFSSAPGAERIQHGDLIHVDFGITYLRLNTDTQVHAYVLRPGETQPPAGLLAALAAGNRAQDLLLAQFARGRSGNQVLEDALAAAREEGLQATIYTHPLRSARSRRGTHHRALGPATGSPRPGRRAAHGAHLLGDRAQRGRDRSRVGREPNPRDARGGRPLRR